MSDATIRGDIKTLLLTVPSLGGDDPTTSNRRIHAYSFDNDDEAEGKEFWQTTINGSTVLCGVMLRREDREDEEPIAGRHFIEIHRYVLLFRYSKHTDPLAEKTAQDLLDATLDKLRGASLFKRDGLHPEGFAEQVGKAHIVPKRLWNQRAWEAEIRLAVVEQTITANWAQQ